MGGAPGHLTLHDIARAINGDKKVKLGFFDPDPYPGECNFMGIASLGGFPFGGRRQTPSTQPSPNVWRGVTSMGSGDSSKKKMVAMMTVQ